MTIKVFVAEHCQPCHNVVQKIKEGRFNQEKVDLIDIETPEGFAQFKKEVLDTGDGVVPSAYQDGTKCSISFDDEENIVIDCPSTPPSAPEPEKSALG